MKKFQYDYYNPKYKILKGFKKLEKSENDRIQAKLKIYTQQTFNELKPKILRQLKNNELVDKRIQPILLRASFCGKDDYEKNIYQLYAYKKRLIGIILNDIFIIISINKKIINIKS